MFWAKNRQMANFIFQNGENWVFKSPNFDKELEKSNKILQMLH
jgi:hypothetical protein